MAFMTHLQAWRLEQHPHEHAADAPMTQGDLARAARTTRHTIQLIEGGWRSQGPAAQRLSRRSGIPVQFLALPNSVPIPEPQRGGPSLEQRERIEAQAVRAHAEAVGA